MKDTYQVYDGREHFVKELVDRAREFLNSSPQQPGQWYESLMDYFAFVSPALKDKDVYLKRIRDIRAKIFMTRIGGRTATEAEKQKMLNDAYDELWDIFIEMHCIVYNSGWYVPISKIKDPHRAFANYYPAEPSEDDDND